MPTIASAKSTTADVTSRRFSSCSLEVIKISDAGVLTIAGSPSSLPGGSEIGGSSGGGSGGYTQLIGSLVGGASANNASYAGTGGTSSGYFGGGGMSGLMSAGRTGYQAATGQLNNPFTTYATGRAMPGRPARPRASSA